MKRSYLAAIPALALLLTTVVGCDKGDETCSHGDSTCKAGEQSSAKEKLIGTWKLDTEQMKEAMMAEMANQTADDPNAEMAAAMIEGMIAQMEMTFEFKDDGKILITQNMGGEAQTEENTWTLTGEEDDTITLEVDGEAVKASFDGNDVLNLFPPEEEELPPGMTSMRFTRVTE